MGALTSAIVGPFARGLLVGVLVAAPVGPMALLAIRRTLDRGLPSGLASGLGIATADGIYAAISAFGLTAISSLLLAGARPVELAGGLLIALLGLRGVFATPATRPAGDADGRGLLAAYGSCLGLTLANPPTILSFAALAAGLGIATLGPASAGAFVAGAFLGSAAWWLLLTGGVARARTAFTPRIWVLVSRGAGLLLLGLGLLLAARAAFAA